MKKLRPEVEVASGSKDEEIYRVDREFIAKIKKKIKEVTKEVCEDLKKELREEWRKEQQTDNCHGNSQTSVKVKSSLDVVSEPEHVTRPQ